MSNERRRRAEEERIAREQHEVPHPNEVLRAVSRVQKSQSITFEVDLNGWRMVWLSEGKPMYNQVRPELTMLFYKPVPVVATPFMPDIPGYVALSLATLGTGHATMMMENGRQIQVGFRAANSESEAWLRLQFARAMGMRFREHGYLNKDTIIYTKDA